MKHIKTTVLTTAAMMAFASCSQKGAQENEGTKSLVVYYSQTGATKAVAQELQTLTGADIDSIVVAENPYAGTYEETIARCQKEMADSILPVLKPLTADIAKYDTIYLGYPVWFGTFARPMMAYLSNTNLEGKVVIPFCTFGSGGLLETSAALRNEQPAATVLEGYGVRNARIDAMPKELERFLKEHHFIAGEIEPLPEYSEQKPVTAAEQQIFDQACGDYPFPLGTPKTVGSRKGSEGTDYRFTSELFFGVDDSGSVFTVYVTLVEGQKPVFTRVER